MSQQQSAPQRKTSTRLRTTTDHGDDSVLSLYLRDINRIPLLTRQQEVDCATRARDGDEAAKEHLVRANLRFVVNVAKKYQNQGLPLTDLISEGNIGLMNAVERFDVTKGYHFISYAVWWIRQAILKAVCEKSRMIRLPLNRANELVQIEKARKQLQGDRSAEPRLSAVAKEVDMTASHVESLVSISRDLVSLDSPVGVDRDASTIGDFVADTDYQSPEEQAQDSALRDQINRVLATLTEKEADIIVRRFGLNGKQPLSLKEIGARYRLTKERIRQIEKKALRRLRHPSRSQYLEAFASSA
jgi:RNA polymerase primary sigma factor